MRVVWFWLVLAIHRTGATLDHLDVEVEYQCIQHCPLQNRTDAGHYDYACDYGCNINQCDKGCKLWRKALNSSCQKVCNGPMDRLTPKELYCVMGCNDAMTKYFSQLKSKLLIPPPPALVADSLNATSLKLEWNFPEAKRVGLSQHVQWKYEELTATWHFCRNVTWSHDDTVVLIENLQPYTKYRFRIVLILGHQENSIVSNPSVVISTLPSGIPVSPPSSDIAAENNFYMFRNLCPSRNYTISIKMRNGVGSGPSAKVTVSTPSEPLAKDTQQPVLILGTEHGVIEQGTNILDEPEILYSTLMTIKGIGIHINKKLIFISDSGGHIIKMPLSKNHPRNNITYILSPFQINFMPLDLSVDWLNDQLYILGEVKRGQQRIWQIARCDLEGRGMTIAVAGLRTEPYNIEVDPYNGYLFWAIHEHEAGIYRLDISDISNGIKHDVRPVKVLQDANLGAFTVDHTNFRLFVANEKQHTINSVSLDGKEKINVRPKIINSKLQKVVSLAAANKRFYWTNGDDIFFEEYHNSDYFHNSYPDLSARSYKKVIVNLTSSQPIPSPVNPPTNVQAIFGTNIAKTTWQPPHLLGIQGKGAWQNWSYEIAIKEINSQQFVSHSNINATSYKISGLKENTEYVIKVAAYTKSGKGPWSSEFRGITLSRVENPAIYWSAAKGLLKSDAAGENVETLIHKSQMKNFYFADMTWYKNQIYLVSNDSRIHWYNTMTHSQGQLTDIDSAESIAVDWIGMKLYWSNPKRQSIFRGNLNGTQQEHLRIFVIAKELNIDSVKAYLYWSTGYAVSCARLNGENAMEYHPVQLFSGRQVMGLTLDIKNKFAYWIVQGSEGSNLFRAPMAGYSTGKITPEKISSLQKPNMQGGLCYFHKRLLWLQDDKNAAISDLQGKNIAAISGKSMSDLTLVYVVDSSLHVMPDTPTGAQIVVIPETVDKNSVRVIGALNSFNVSWDPVTNVNYGQVFYEVGIDSLARNDSTIITTSPSVKYWQQVAPFTKLHVAIRAFTYWGTSLQIRAKVYSPASTPSVPRNLRAYVTHPHSLSSDNHVTVTVRWDAPMFPNGVVKGYKLHCWYFDSSETRKDLCEHMVKPATNFQIDLTSLEKHQVYYFNLQAYSEVGDGDLSQTISVNSSQESPLPRLLIASSDSIFIQDIDSDQNELFLRGIITPIEIGYSIGESKLFWINQLQDLMMYNMITFSKTKIVDLVKNATSLTVDWLERSLYFAQIDSDSGSSVFKLDLNYIDRGTVKTTKVFSTSTKIGKIEVSPYTKKLYWVEQAKLMVCSTDGTDRREFFRTHKSCDCPVDTNIEETYTLDHSSEIRPKLIFVDSVSQNVISADPDGCFCDIIANNSVGVTLPLERIKSDLGTLYWTNSQGLLHALKKNDANVVTKEVNLNDVVIFGPHMQPFPPKECLKPKQHDNLKVELKHRTSSSLTFGMPEVSSVCQDTSMPTVEYRIYYTQQNEERSCDLNCNLSVTFEKEYTIEKLKPFTNYIVSVGVGNYYTEDQQVVLGPSSIFQTAVGAPSQPQNVTAVVLSPTMAKVTWWPPQQFNGATVHYEIYCQTERTLSGVRQKEQPNVEQFSPNSTQFLTTVLSKLSPNETYMIWVRAYSETNETSSDSEKVQVSTYPEPSDLILVNRSAYGLRLAWEVHSHIENYSVQFSPITSNEWENITVDNSSDGIVIVRENLKPKTQYRFRLSLFYENHPEEYIWPLDSRFTYETLGDRPSPPGTPEIQYVKPNIYKVWWEASKDNGAPIELYKLEALELPNYRTKRSTNRTSFFYTAPSIEEKEREWQDFYNGTETSWIIDGLSEKYKYEFRVSAFNAYGWSDPSEPSIAFDPNEAAKMAEKQSPMALVAVAIFIPVSVFLVIILCIVCRKFGKPKKVQVVSIQRGPDVELATLRELPRRGVHNTNVLYVSTQPASDELTLLPHIRRDQITLMKFLGSGAFGEVFEGKAKGISNATSDTKVAVKTLRKGATDQEKTEFLQEAQLMSNFKHEHILQLLGVCLDNDPHFIIMELMQGGDLLTYLRSSRNLNIETPSLTLIELLKMCVDVAKGCRYLEEMHFVHRDLACRNCLVSSKETDRIVKIGDFGLARDIYKNDYYRKEGEGLLPVRWMAPESLVDGVFTSQSDVWAFGVLLWEIMTLGQQPYPARNNLEVLHYVRRGGRLGKPTDCPETLHNLMLKCWEFEADKRPTFKYCLDVLESLHFQKLRSPTTGAHEGQYISTVQECEIEDDSNKEKTPFLPPEASSIIPKYLELLYEPDLAPPNDGYEIPNQMLADSTKRSSSIVSIPTEITKVQSNGNVPEIRDKSLKKVKKNCGQ